MSRSAENKAAQNKAKAALEQQLAATFMGRRAEVIPKEATEGSKKKNHDEPRLATPAKKDAGKSFDFTVKLKDPDTEFDISTDANGKVQSASVPRTDPPFDPSSHQAWDEDKIKANAEMLKMFDKGDSPKLHGTDHLTVENAAGFMAAAKQAGFSDAKVQGLLSNVGSITDEAGNSYSITDTGKLADSKGNEYDVDATTGKLTDKDGNEFDPSSTAPSVETGRDADTGSNLDALGTSAVTEPMRPDRGERMAGGHAATGVGGEGPAASDTAAHSR